MQLWYLSHQRPVKAQASLRIHAVSPEPLLFAHMNYGSRHLAPLYGWACIFEKRIYRGQKVPKSHELAHFLKTHLNPLTFLQSPKTIKNAKGFNKTSIHKGWLAALTQKTTLKSAFAELCIRVLKTQSSQLNMSLGILIITLQEWCCRF